MIQSDALTPFARSILDAFTEPALVFDSVGRLVFANQAARSSLATTANLDNGDYGPQLMTRLAAMGPTVKPLWIGETKVGEIVVLPRAEGPDTLAERERKAIIDTLNATGWRLTAAARRLGISRTTLWRRLKRYGHNRDGRSKWSNPS
jgi:transcriptional regulator with GAF, ATPase, and Fis domain